MSTIRTANCTSRVWLGNLVSLSMAISLGVKRYTTFRADWWTNNIQGKICNIRYTSLFISK